MHTWMSSLNETIQSDSDTMWASQNRPLCHRWWHTSQRPLSCILKVLTLSMLRLVSSKEQGRIYFWKPPKPCHAGIHWIALLEYSQMPVHMCQGFNHFSDFSHHFVMAKLVTRSIRVKLESQLYSILLSKSIERNQLPLPWMHHTVGQIKAQEHLYARKKNMVYKTIYTCTKQKVEYWVIKKFNYWCNHLLNVWRLIFTWVSNSCYSHVRDKTIEGAHYSVKTVYTGQLQSRKKCWTFTGIYLSRFTIELSNRKISYELWTQYLYSCSL